MNEVPKYRQMVDEARVEKAVAKIMFHQDNVKAFARDFVGVLAESNDAEIRRMPGWGCMVE